MPAVEPILFSLESSRDFATDVSQHLNITLGEHEERDFEDGEHKTRPLVSVRGRHVYVIQSLYSDQQQIATNPTRKTACGIRSN